MTFFPHLIKLFPPLQILKFCLVGLANTAVYLAVFYGCLMVSPDLYQLGNLLGFVAGVLCAWFLSRHFVFRTEDSLTPQSRLETLVKSYLSYGLTTLMAALLLWLFIERLGVDPYLAPALTLFFTVPANFLLNKFWTFAGRRRPSSRHSPQHGSVSVSGDLS